MSRIWSFYNVSMYTNITLCPTNSYQLKIKQNSLFFFKDRTLKTVKMIHFHKYSGSPMAHRHSA